MFIRCLTYTKIFAIGIVAFNSCHALDRKAGDSEDRVIKTAAGFYFVRIAAIFSLNGQAVIVFRFSVKCTSLDFNSIIHDLDIARIFESAKDVNSIGYVNTRCIG